MLVGKEFAEACQSFYVANASISWVYMAHCNYTHGIDSGNVIAEIYWNILCIMIDLFRLTCLRTSYIQTESLFI